MCCLPSSVTFHAWPSFPWRVCPSATPQMTAAQRQPVRPHFQPRAQLPPSGDGPPSSWRARSRRQWPRSAGPSSYLAAGDMTRARPARSRIPGPSLESRDAEIAEVMPSAPGLPRPGGPGRYRTRKLCANAQPAVQSADRWRPRRKPGRVPRRGASRGLLAPPLNRAIGRARGKHARPSLMRGASCAPSHARSVTFLHRSARPVLSGGPICVLDRQNSGKSGCEPRQSRLQESTKGSPKANFPLIQFFSVIRLESM